MEIKSQDRQICGRTKQVKCRWLDKEKEAEILEKDRQIDETDKGVNR